MENLMTRQESLGQLIKRLRKAKDWTLKDLIHRVTSSTKRKRLFSPSYITRIEADDDIPNPELIIALAEALDCNVSDMLKVAKEQHKEKALRKIDVKYDEANKKYYQGCSITVNGIRASNIKGTKGAKLIKI